MIIAHQFVSPIATAPEATIEVVTFLVADSGMFGTLVDIAAPPWMTRILSQAVVTLAIIFSRVVYASQVVRAPLRLALVDVVAIASESVQLVSAFARFGYTFVRSVGFLAGFSGFTRVVYVAFVDF